jgi:DHA2 family methylenomycin A resistance protein-like MFS transporter
MTALAAGLGMFLAALDISVNVALPLITSDFQTDYQTVQWFIIVFIATRAGLGLGAGSFADRFGLRRVYIFGAATYLVAMVCIALSPTFGIAVGFRVLQALGTGCLFAASPAIAAGLFPPSRRGLSMGMTTGSQALGMLAGTIGAGLLAGWLGWQVVFLGRVPFALLALFVGFVWLRRNRRHETSESFDVLGAVTLFGVMLCLMVGLRLGRSIGWTSPVVMGLLTFAPLFLAAFWWSERRAAWPVLPFQMFRVRGVVISSVTMFMAHFGAFVIWFIFPFYVVDSLGYGPFTLGVMMAVMAAANTGFSATGGWLCDRVGTTAIGTIGLTVLSVGLLLMGFLDAESGLEQVALRIALVGVGTGLFQASAFTLMMSSVPAQRFATAGAAVALAQSLGTVLSVAVTGGLFALSNGYHLSVLGAEGLGAADSEARAFVLAYRDVFWMGAAITIVATGVFLMGRRPKIRKESTGL